MNIKPNDLFGFIVEDLSRQMRRRFEKAFGEGQSIAGMSRGLSRGEARVLASIFINPGMTNTDLAERLDIQKISLTHMVNTLENAGQVERRLDPQDRRKRQLYVTPAAKPVLDRIWDVLAQVSTEVVSVLPPERALTFVEDLARVRDFMMNKSERR